MIQVLNGVHVRRYAETAVSRSTAKISQTERPQHSRAREPGLLEALANVSSLNISMGI